MSGGQRSLVGSGVGDVGAVDPFALDCGECGVQSFDVIRARTERLATAGQLVGRAVEVCDASGRTVDYRRPSYSSMLAAGCDALLAEAEVSDPDRAERIRARMALVSRYEAMEQLRELSDVEPGESSYWSPRRSKAEPRTPPDPGRLDLYSPEARSFEMAERIRDANAARRTFEIERYHERERARLRDFSPTRAAFSQKVALIGFLTQWDAEHPTLAAEIAQWEATLGRR